MIRSLFGTITGYTETSVVLNVHDVGYLIYTNAGRYSYSEGEEYKFHTYLAVRETALDLYGFRTVRELEFFELLLSVPKIGPKSALQILCQADPDLLATAIVLNDADHLHKVSGIGKKTAANIVSNLAGKIDDSFTPTVTELKPETNFNAAQTDAIDALISLGYDSKEARLFVMKQDSTQDAKALIQAALKQGSVN